MNGHPIGRLLTKEEAAARMKRMGAEYSVHTLRAWRATWPDGECKGPMPLLISTRRLRYREEDVDAFIRDVVASAQHAAQPGSATA